MELAQEREIVEKIANHSVRIDEAEKKIDKLENQAAEIQSLALSVQKLAHSVEQIAKDQTSLIAKQNEMVKNLAEVEKKPDKTKAEKYDRVIKEITTLLLGAIVGFLIKTFLGI